VTSDTGVSIVPSATFDECPAALDVLFVPGGTVGMLNAMNDPPTLDFLVARGAGAKWVTSVCTGSLLLGAAGLLRGYRATSHWVTLDLLRLAGATPVDERVVFDRNRVTGAGVSAGLDMGLAMVERLRDREYAQAVQLLAEYAPQPPLDAGSPRTAPAPVRELLDKMFAGFVERTANALRATAR
jgi:cyclohexyl-isocyanide hydratase